MRKKFLVFLMSVAATVLVAAPLAVLMTDWQYIDGILYLCDNDTDEAVLSDVFEALGDVYQQDEIVIPASFTLTGGGISQGGTSGATKTYKVTEIGEYGLYGALASRIVFATPSNVSTIRENALCDMANMTGKLTLPASLEHLDVSSILLPGITEIEFLGEVPPTCDIAGGYNPWTSATEVTSADIKITIPEGALSAYQDAEGIGDYFTCLKKEDPTSVDNAVLRSAQQKMLLSGHLYILHEGRLFNALGQQFR